MSLYKDLRDEIVSELVATNLFTEVVKTPKASFDGTPVAVVLPSEVMSDYITVAQNQRAYGFLVDIHVVLEKQDWDTAIEQSMDLIDGVIDRLDQTVDLNGKADFLRAVPLMQWATEKDAGGLIAMPSIHVVAIKDVNVR